MRIDVYAQEGRRIGKAKVDLRSPPVRVAVRSAEGSVTDHYLDWEKALDDRGRLRKCPVCGCPDLYVRSVFPPLTGFVVVLVVGMLCFALYGLEYVPPGPLLIAGGAIILANIIFIFFSPRYLACYRCASRFHEAGISRDWQEWDAATASRYRPAAIRDQNPQVSEDARD